MTHIQVNFLILTYEKTYVAGGGIIACSSLVTVFRRSTTSCAPVGTRSDELDGRDCRLVGGVGGGRGGLLDPDERDEWGSLVLSFVMKYMKAPSPAPIAAAAPRRTILLDLLLSLIFVLFEISFTKNKVISLYKDQTEKYMIGDHSILYMCALSQYLNHARTETEVKLWIPVREYQRNARNIRESPDDGEKAT